MVTPGAPVPDWAQEGAWLCWSLIPVAVPLPAGLGTARGPALGQAGCLPCGLPAQWLPAVVGEETSLRGREVLYVWRGGLTPRPAAGCSILSFTTLKTRGQVPPKGCTCCSTSHLVYFRGNLLAESRGNVEKGVGGTGVCVSHLFLMGNLVRSHAHNLGWAGGSGLLVSSCSQSWGQPHAHLAEQREARGSFGQPIWMLQLLPLPSLLLPKGCAVGMAAQGAGPCWTGSAVWHHRLAPCQGEHLAQAQNMPWQDPGAASLLNIDGPCLHGGLGALTPQIIFLAAGPARVPLHSQHSSQVG